MKQQPDDQIPFKKYIFYVWTSIGYVQTFVIAMSLDKAFEMAWSRGVVPDKNNTIITQPSNLKEFYAFICSF